MGPFLLLALLSGSALAIGNSGSDNDDDLLREEPEDRGQGGSVGDTFDPEDEEPLDPEEEPDTGASFALTGNGVELELGEDETGSLAVIYYTDTEDADEFLETYEARFYLVPEGVDWSDASWENRNDIPGSADFGETRDSYELEDFEKHFGLELLGKVDLKDTLPVGPDDRDTDEDRVVYEDGSEYGPFDPGLVITANAPVAAYYLEANTDGDDLVSFLPEDYVITRDGLAAVYVSQDTTGTGDAEWLISGDDGIMINGAGGDDLLDSLNADVTLAGGAGNDVIQSGGIGTVAYGGDGDDEISLTGLPENDFIVDPDAFAGAYGGNGNDVIDILNGTADGGSGDDRLSAIGDLASLYGGAGDDSVLIGGEGSEGFGGDGDDFISVAAGAVGRGGSGSDFLQVDSGGTAYGGDGDDLFTVWNHHYDPDGPAIITGGAGVDTIDALVWGAANGEADDIYLRISDFDPAEDVLQVGSFDSGNRVDEVEIVEAPDGSYTDVRVTYTSLHDLEPGIAVIRLEGTTGFTADQVVITS